MLTIQRSKDPFPPIFIAFYRYKKTEKYKWKNVLSILLHDITCANNTN